jgi:MarR family transcriptional regulator, transcriptional regulator for hemolysin
MVPLDAVFETARALVSDRAEDSADMKKAPAGRARAADEGTDEDWGIRLGFYIHDTSRLRRVIYDAAFKPLGVTRSQAWVLAYLSRTDGMPQSELANQLDLGKVALGGLVDRLEAIGLVARQADSNDRRVKRIVLTEDGKKVVKQLRAISGPTNTEILHGISPADVRATAKTLRAIKANLLKMANGKGLEGEGEN